MKDVTQSGAPNRWRSRGAAAALVAGGLLAGGVLASTLAATAAGTSPSADPSSTAAAPAAPDATRDESKSQRPDETLLTGTTAAKVRAAALAKYPGATIDRLETDSEGVYEAHVTTKAGDDVIVQVGKAFTVTGTQAGLGHGGPGGPGDHDGDGPAAG